jgi:acetylornithine deacetylase
MRVAVDDAAIMDAVAAEAAWGEELLVRLVAQPSVLGNEEGAQAVVAEALRELGLEPVDVPMDAAALRAHPAAAPFDWDVSGKRNLTAVWGCAGGGRSLLLNGHVDVVSPGPESLWRSAPFQAVREGDWLYGRGAGDMKAGLAAMLTAVRGLMQLGVEPDAPVRLQSVVEEECSGNGALACLLAGHTADAAVIVEPFGAAITTAQVGVLWFDVRVAGRPAHAANASAGTNAIEATFPIVHGLRELEAELNAEPPPPFDGIEHPINLNVGVIEGGDWPSTVAAECVTRFRLALYPGERVEALKARVEAAVGAAATADPFLAENPPQISYHGFSCEGSVVGDDHPLVTALSAAFQRQAGTAPALVATTGTTDARTYLLHGGIPAVCFGPYAESVHGVDERVHLPSVVQAAQVLALFVRDWCGVTT